MSSIRWSALFLSLAAPLACAPHYDVGDADQSAGAGSGGDGSGGSSTTGGTGDTGGTGGSSIETGGTGTTGGSGGTNGSGGSSTTGGSGGSGEVGGSSAGGSDATGGTGGSSLAGYGGTGGAEPPPACGEEIVSEYPSTLATPDVVWERISQFLYDEVRDPPSELPEETTPQWAVEILRETLDQSRRTSASGRAALIPFMQKFLDAEPAGAVGDPPYELWARMVGAEGSRLGVLFEGDEESNPPFGFFGTVAERYDGLTQRGTFLVERLFCMEGARPPTELPPVMVGPNQTRRDALVANTIGPACVGCHAVLDPLAYPLEVLAPGTLEYRTTENGLPIDTSGEFYGNRGEAFVFSDLPSLGEQLSVSCEVARCITLQLLDEAMPDAAFVADSPEVERALHAFAAPEATTEERFQFQALLEAIVSSPAFLE